MNSMRGIPDKVEGPLNRVDMGSPVAEAPELADATLKSTHEEVQAAIAAAEESQAGAPGHTSGASGHTSGASGRTTDAGTGPVEPSNGAGEAPHT